jgi:hemolysin III
MNPTYARSERIADGIIHAAGLTLAITGAVLLIVLAAPGATGMTIVAISVYGGALIATFAASALYHMTPWARLRPMLQRIDHAAIYLKIAGTYTPLVVLIGSAFGYVVLGIVWTLAVIGAAAKLLCWHTPGRFGLLLYLGLGWLAVFLIWPLIPVMPPVGLILIVTGGVLYSAGVIFLRWDGLRFAMAIWHGFVLAASGCFFAAISLGLAA